MMDVALKHILLPSFSALMEPPFLANTLKCKFYVFYDDDIQGVEGIPTVDKTPVYPEYLCAECADTAQV